LRRRPSVTGARTTCKIFTN